MSLRQNGEACELLRFIDDEGRPNREALRQFLARVDEKSKADPEAPKPPKQYRRGNKTLYHREDLEKLLVRVK